MFRLLTILLLSCSVAGSQPAAPYLLHTGITGNAWRLHSKFSMFPDSLRNAKPHEYKGISYPAPVHYSDNSVLVYVPEYFIPSRKIELVWWFHGWFNNIDSSLRAFRLLEQFQASGRNAIFIFPEGPVNAPDSYGGQLEQVGMAASLTVDVLQFLQQQGMLGKYKASNIITRHLLAGHSGAYRVIAKMMAGNPEIANRCTVLLFDGLYGEMAAYRQLAANPTCRLVHIYTDTGGTDENSRVMMSLLEKEGIDFLHAETDSVTERALKENRVIILHSKLGHNAVITENNQFTKLLQYCR